MAKLLPTLLPKTPPLSLHLHLHIRIHINMASSSLEVETINLVEMKNKNNNVVSTCGSGNIDHEGVKITWENLWVNVSDGKSGSKSILQGLTGYARPGEVLAIMGPSGCGKSTLLDALAGIHTHKNLFS